MRTVLNAIAIVIALVLLHGPVIAKADTRKPHGSFTGDVIVKWLSDGRSMELIQELTYTDPQGGIWKVPKGSKIDGASIPEWMWSIVGSPFVGKYRRASVIHDHYCDVKRRSWRKTHRVFYHASLADGVDLGKAKHMYLAIFARGPRWKTNPAGCLTCSPTIDIRPPKIEDEKLVELQNWIDRDAPDLDEIETRVNKIGGRYFSPKSFLERLLNP